MARWRDRVIEPRRAGAPAGRCVTGHYLARVARLCDGRREAVNLHTISTRSPSILHKTGVFVRRGPFQHWGGDDMSQSEWRWCHKCQGMFFMGNATSGFCPAGDAHESSGSGDYTLETDPGDPGQHNWRWCNLCSGLFFAGFPTTGSCPAPKAGGHNWSGSGDYSVHYGPNPPGEQGDWRWCHRCQGLFFSGNPTSGFCPAGGGHDYANSENYRVTVG